MAKNDSIRPTRYPELGYTTYCRIWRIVATDTRNVIGPIYMSKAELLADLPRYAAEYGCDNAYKPAAPYSAADLEARRLSIPGEI